MTSLADAALAAYRKESAQMAAEQAARAAEHAAALAEQDQLRAAWVRQEVRRLSPEFTNLFLRRMGLASDHGQDLHWYMPVNLYAGPFERGESEQVRQVSLRGNRASYLQADIDAITIRAYIDQTSEDENPLRITLVNEASVGQTVEITDFAQLGRLLSEARDSLADPDPTE